MVSGANASKRSGNSPGSVTEASHSKSTLYVMHQAAPLTICLAHWAASPIVINCPSSSTSDTLCSASSSKHNSCRRSCVQEYHQLPEEGSHVVNTAWALLALVAAGYHKRDQRPLDAAARCLMNSQLSNGDWPQQHISGVFNRNCMITYANYR